MLKEGKIRKAPDQGTAWAIAGIGVLHAAATLSIYKQFSMAAVWFFDAAVVLWLTAALNLLRIRYMAVAPGVRYVSIGANLVALATVMTVAAQSKPAQNVRGALFCLLILAATIFSLRQPRATAGGQATR